MVSQRSRSRSAVRSRTAASATKSAAAAVAGPLTSDGRGWKVSSSPSPGKLQYTWEEVAAHNTDKSAWVYYENKVYDITSWFNSHPGGRHVLTLCAGRDVTDMIHSYHPFSDKPLKILQKYEIGELTTTEFPQYKSDSGFYKEIRTECGKYFKSRNINYKDPLPGLMRLLFFFIGAGLCYYHLVTGHNNASAWSLVAASVFLGVFQALPLLHCMHDASHTSIGSSEFSWNFIGRLCMDWFAGASMNSWHNQHVLGHHLYTNVMGVDPDLPITKSGDLRRVSPQQIWAPIYRFQQFYLLILYGLLGLKFRIQDITGTLISCTNGQIRVNSLGKTEIFSQIITKSLWAYWRIYLPLYYFKVPLNQFLILFIITEFMTGYYLAFNFQVSHVSPDVEFPELKNSPVFEQEWAQSQLLTTVDYAHDDWFAALACGALNYQSVHHLFPSVSQYHYPALAPIIQRIAKKYGIKYNYVGSFWDAFVLHVKYLEKMGFNPDKIHMDY